MNCKYLNVRRISRAMTSAIAMTLGITALAQDSARLRMPRRVFEGKIDIRNANIADAATAADPNAAQGPGPGPIGPGPGCNVFPAPPSVGATVNLSYFGPSPSTVNRSLVGPVQLLNTGPVDVAKGTITIPLYLGHMKNGKNVWFILTDVDDSNVADELGLNFSAKLTFAAANGARTANFDDNNDLVFDKGTVDFSPVRSVTPGPAGHEFPPVAFQPGSVGDKDYSPLVQVANAGGVVYNAPIVAFDVNANDINFRNGNVDYSKVHDQVVAIDPVNMTVTLNLINGFSFGKPVWYLSMETSIPLGAAIEHNTFAPLQAALQLGRDDSFSSPIERIFIATNGPEEGGCANPLRQGLSADLADGFRPNNVVGGIPTNALDYSPVWDAQLYEWTQDSINKGYRGQLREEFQILTLVQDGVITGPNGAPFASSRFSINCPIVQRLN
jgi:hypothetical protein